MIVLWVPICRKRIHSSTHAELPIGPLQTPKAPESGLIFKSEEINEEIN